MKKALWITCASLGILLGSFLGAAAVNCGSVFPTLLNNYTAECSIPSSWANALEQKIGINQSTDTTSLDYRVQHIASSSLPASGVASGTYTNATISVSSSGVVTAASNGAGGGSGSLSTTTPWNSGYIPVVSSTPSAVTNSNIYQSSTLKIGIGTSNPSSTLHVIGTIQQTNATNTLDLLDANGKITAYGGSSCAASSNAVTGISAVGGTNCAGFAQTSTANTWSALQTFTNGLTSNATLTVNANVSTTLPANSFVATDSRGVLVATGTPSGSSSGGISSVYWQTWNQTSTRSSNTRLLFTDSGNASTSQNIFTRNTPIKWLENGTTKTAVVVSSTYSSNVLTVDIVGDAASSNFSSTSSPAFAEIKAKPITFAYAGTIGATSTDAMGHYYLPYDTMIFAIDCYTGTAGTTGNTVFALAVQGTEKGSCSIATTATSSAMNSIDATASSTQYLSVNVSSTQTTAAVDGYVNVFTMPYWDRSMTP